MNNIYIYDSTDINISGKQRGGGRIVQLLKENLSKRAIFVSDLSKIPFDAILIVPVWSPFQTPILTKRFCKIQILYIFDVIPLKFNEHFPSGIRGNVSLWRNLWSMQNVDRIITISKHSRKNIVQYLNVKRKKIDIVYPTISKIYAETTGKITKSGPLFNIPRDYCLYVGDVNWNKNIVNLARSIKLADVPCVFAGKMFTKDLKSKKHVPGINHPWGREFKEFLRETREDDRFIFLGFVSDDKLINLYKKARCNVLVSRDEGFGLSYLEAATQKCPSVLSNISIFREITQDSAIFASYSNPADIAKKITGFFKNTIKRNKLGEIAYTQVQQYYPHNFKRELLKILL